MYDIVGLLSPGQVVDPDQIAAGMQLMPNVDEASVVLVGAEKIGLEAVEAQIEDIAQNVRLVEVDVAAEAQHKADLEEAGVAGSKSRLEREARG